MIQATQKKYADLILDALFFWYVLSPILKRINPVSAFDLSRIFGSLIVVLLTKPFFTMSFGRIPQKLLFSIFIFLSALFINIFTGSDYFESFIIFFRIYGGMCILIFFYCNSDKRIAEKTTKFIVMISIITAIYTILQFAVYKMNMQYAYKIFGENSFLISFATVRPRGLINSAGGSASIMSLGIIIFIRKLIIGETIQRDKFFAVIILCGLMLNLTRTFIISLCFFSILIFWYYGRYKLFIKIVVISFFILSTLFLGLGTKRFLDRLNDIPILSSRAVKHDQAFMGRDLLLKIPLIRYKNVGIFNKIIGSGLAWSAEQIKGYFIRFFPNRKIQTSTHDDFVWLLCNVGIIGLLAYSFFIWSVVDTYKYQMRFFFALYVIIFVLLTGVGGETINITGHRYLQFLYTACLYNTGNRTMVEIDS